jgi:protein phosphatase
MSVKIDAFGVTDIGKSRETNDDNFMIVEIRKSIDVTHSSLSREALGEKFGARGGHLFAVADGVGSGPAGDQASGDTIAAVLRYVSGVVGCFDVVTTKKEHEFFEHLEATVQQVHESLISTPGFHSQTPATTLTMILLLWPRAYFVHVGDSRAYVRRGGKTQQLTRDQTFGEYMQSLGAWTEEQAAKSVPGATLTSAIGGPQLEPSVGLIDLEQGDSLLLCTDGLIRYVDDERIDSVLGQKASSESMARTLVQEALDGGGRDNISVIVVRAEAA